MMARPLRITLLGTGTSTGVPMLGCTCEVCMSSDDRDRRLRSSALIETDEKSILIDAGPDLREQLLTYRIQRIDAVLITHYHKDHLGGLDDLRAFTIRSKKPIPVYATEETQAGVQREVPYAFEQPIYETAPKLDLNVIQATTSFIVLDTIAVTPIKVSHGDMPIVGFRIGDFSYITDCNKIESAEKNKVRGSKHLVLNGIRHKPHNSHFNLQEAVALIQELAIPRAYITHISDQLGKYSEVNPTLPEGIQLGYDGLQIDAQLCE